ncbi:MAG TPA: hypothetical protein VMY42_24165 [Thermoguttaceae bacterium]|nr:hypothetical protein [Thermoguttaceae bacterium]
MRYAVVVVMLTAAAAMILRYEQKAAGRQTEKSGEKSSADEGSEAEKPDEKPLLLLEDDDPPLLLDDAPPLLLDDDPPLLLDDDPPLLLDDDPTGPGERKPVADNSRCHHCHLNYADEDLVVQHAEANISCADCHGNCDEHIADESWASGGNGTPPEKMYPREKINPLCVDCHPKEELGKLEHQRFLAGTAGEKYCTDCHGDHRLGERTCKWK